MYRSVVQPFVRKILSIATPIEMYSICVKKRPPVLHVGAHLGEEDATYKEFGFQEVSWIEAQPEVFKQLIKRVPPSSCLQAAIWSESTKLDLFISNNSVSTSLFEFGLLTPWKNLSTLSRIEVEALTLQDAVSIFNQRNQLINPFVLLLDIQGAEMEALKTLKPLVPRVLAISCEVSIVPTYSNSAARKSILLFLTRHKFLPICSFLDKSTGHGDQLFVRLDHLIVNPKLLIFCALRATILRIIRFNKRQGNNH